MRLGLLVGRALKIAHVRESTEMPANVDAPKCKPTHQNIIRLAPPLVITDEQIRRSVAIIGEAMNELPTLKGKKEDEVIPPGEKAVKITLEN